MNRSALCGVCGGFGRYRVRQDVAYLERGCRLESVRCRSCRGTGKTRAAIVKTFGTTIL